MSLLQLAHNHNDSQRKGYGEPAHTLDASWQRTVMVNGMKMFTPVKPIKLSLKGRVRDKIRRLKADRNSLIILALWLGLLVSIRMLVRYEFNSLYGGLGTLALSFFIIFFIFRQNRFKRFAKPVKQVLRKWYTRKSVTVLTIIFALYNASVYGMIEYANYAYKDDIALLTDGMIGANIYTDKQALQEWTARFNVWVKENVRET